MISNEKGTLSTFSKQIGIYMIILPYYHESVGSERVSKHRNPKEKKSIKCGPRLVYNKSSKLWFVPSI